MKFRADFILVIAESFQRWGQKSPKFFRVWRTANAILCFIGSSSWSLAQLGIVGDQLWIKIVSGIIAFCGAYGVAMTTLAVSKPVDLPFTEKKQIEEAIAQPTKKNKR